MTARALVAACLLLAAGCASGTSLRAYGEGWSATLSWTPRRPVALQPVVLRLRLTGPADAPLEVLELQAEAGMPEMDHGVEAVEFRRMAPGVYEARHVFSMDGRWVIRIRGKAGRSDASFVVHVGR